MFFRSTHDISGFSTNCGCVHSTWKRATVRSLTHGSTLTSPACIRWSPRPLQGRKRAKIFRVYRFFSRSAPSLVMPAARCNESGQNQPRGGCGKDDAHLGRESTSRVRVGAGARVRPQFVHRCGKTASCTLTGTTVAGRRAVHMISTTARFHSISHSTRLFFTTCSATLVEGAVAHDRCMYKEYGHYRTRSCFKMPILIANLPVQAFTRLPNHLQRSPWRQVLQITTSCLEILFARTCYDFLAILPKPRWITPGEA